DCSIDCTTAAVCADSRSAQATAAPALAKVSAMARPMPFPAPVTRATFPASDELVTALSSRFTRKHQGKPASARFHRSLKPPSQGLADAVQNPFCAGIFHEMSLWVPQT